MSWLSNFTDDSNGTVMRCAEHMESSILWNCVITLSFVFGFPGAFAVLLVMFQKARKGAPFTPHYVFTLNLAVMDGIYLLFLEIEMFARPPKPNLVFVSLISFLYSFCLCGRPMFITCICLDSYLAVVHPVTYRTRKSLTPRLLMAVGVWTVSVAYGCYFEIRQATEFEIYIILFYVLTLPAIGYCDISILWTLKRSSPGEGTIHPQKKRALQIIINNFVITIISYLPIVIIYLVSKLLFGKPTIICVLMTAVMCVTVVGTTVSS